MKPLPTAEEFLNSVHESNFDIIEVMKDFAKLHVNAALEAAAEDAKVAFARKANIHFAIVNKESILNSYPDDNVK